MSLQDTRQYSQSDRELDHGVLGTADIVFMVMAAASPLSVVVGLMPIAFAFGNGGGVPGTYLFTIVAMMLFAVGYVRIIPFVQNAGAFYAYIAASIGQTSGLAAAYVAALSYFALSCSTLTALSFFGAQFIERSIGVKSHWALWAFASLAAVSVLSYHRITVAAKVLGVALLAEVALALLLDGAIVQRAGLGAFQLSEFSLKSVFAPGLGIAAIYAFDSVLGLEGTAIYQEEARQRDVTVPRATYISVVMVGLFYVLTAWCLASAVGQSRVSAVARSSLGTFVTDQTVIYLGKWAAGAVGLLMVTSCFAAALALFNNSARYLYALARDGVLPDSLSRIHHKHRSPHIAGFVLTLALATVILSAVVAGLDPLVNVTTALVGLGSVGLMALLAVTALAIPIFFLKRQIVSFSTSIAPAAGGVMIAVAVCMAFANYSAVTGVDSVFVNHLPYLLIFVASVGAVQARWIRWRRPDLYVRIGASRVDDVVGGCEPVEA